MERADAPPRTDAGAIATSKLVVPRRRPDIVRRPRLNAMLDAAVGTKGTLVAAPAGYGKTTLVVDWLETCDFAVAWLSLDAWDAALPAFARSFAAALEERSGEPLPLGDERFWQPRTIATVVVNAIAARDDYTVLALDDVQEVEESEPVLALLGMVLECAPENLHV